MTETVNLPMDGEASASPFDTGYPELDRTFRDLQLKQRGLFADKQRDYGPGNINAFGEFGIMVRVSDKLQRLLNLHRKGGIPKNEAVYDTWMDIATYALIALLVRDGKWPHDAPVNTSKSNT